MSTKRLKFLKRLKIRQEDVRIRLDVNGPTKKFKVDLNLADYRFSSDARVVLEAKQLFETIRFELGVVASVNSSATHDVSRLKGERITFNLLVLDPLTSRKLGSAATIRPNREAGSLDSSIPLLPVDASGRVAPLAWEIDYCDQDEEGHTDAPVLKVDSDAAHHSAAFFLQDPVVQVMVLPAAMREVLTKILLVERHTYDPSSRAWKDSWMRFAARLTGEDPPELDESDLAEDANAWISRATRALADNKGLLEAYMRQSAV